MKIIFLHSASRYGLLTFMFSAHLARVKESTSVMETPWDEITNSGMMMMMTVNKGDL
jgi:hypothetical protein